MKLKFVICTTTAILAATAARATTYNWTGGGDDALWTNRANWGNNYGVDWWSFNSSNIGTVAGLLVNVDTEISQKASGPYRMKLNAGTQEKPLCFSGSGGFVFRNSNSNGRIYVGDDAAAYVTIDGPYFCTYDGVYIAEGDYDATVVLESGLLTSETHMFIGRHSGRTGTLTVNGGEVRTGFNGDTREAGWNRTIFVGGNDSSNPGTGILNVNGGLVQSKEIYLGGATGISGMLNINGGEVYAQTIDCKGIGTLNLKGGVLVARSLSNGGNAGVVNFDGGVLRPDPDAETLVGSGGPALKVLAGGVVVSNDTQVSIAKALESGVASGDTDGGLVKRGRGKLIIDSTTIGYNGKTTVESGILWIKKGVTLGDIEVKEGGLVVVDASGDSLTSTDGSSLITHGTITVPAGASAGDYIKAYTKSRISGSSDAAENFWIGGLDGS